MNRINILVRNINGVKLKLKNADVVNICKCYDMLITCESHFGVRTRCPEEFILVFRSKRIVPRKPILEAVYKNVNFYAEIVSCSIRYTDLIITMLYISENSN